MIKRFVIFLLLLAAAAQIAVSAKAGTRVWENPDAIINPRLDVRSSLMRISRVEFKSDETVVYISVIRYPGAILSFNKETRLVADGVDYPVVSADGLELGKADTIPSDGRGEYAFHFKPLPEGTMSFDFIEGKPKNGFNFSGVRDRGTSLLSSNWRDDATGDWMIGLLPDFTIYDSQVWKYDSKDFGRGRFVLNDGRQTLRVEAGKENDGVRSFKIGDRKVKASRIDGMTLGTYPAPGAASEFADNGYRSGDSVTISGCLVNCPADYNQITVMMDNLIADDLVYTATLDSLGCFSLTFPVDNTQTVMFDWKNMNISLPVEPGEKYFFFGDLGKPQRLWMGPKSRLANELMIFDLNKWIDMRSASTAAGKVKMFTDYNADRSRVVDSIVAANPTLSPLWAEWQKQWGLQQTAFHAGQSRFRNPGRVLAPEMKEYIETEIRPSLKDPLGAWNPTMLSAFYTDYAESASDSSPLLYQIPLERDIVAQKWMSQATYEAMRDSIESMRAEIAGAKSTGADKLPEELNKRAMALFHRLVENDKELGYDDMGIRAETEAMMMMLDTLKMSPYERDIVLARQLIDMINSTQESLPEQFEKMINSQISHGSVREKVLSHNDRYKRLSTMDVEPGDGIMVPVDSLLGVSSGKELFDKVMEPFRGRLVIVDVWGIWCGPCRSVLKEFPEHRKELDKYEPVYMFFANRSSEQGWKNTINEYGVTGENVVHYNLPDNLQNMLEGYLGVNSYPSYRLVNTDGSLIDVQIDMRAHNLPLLLGRLTGKADGK